MFGCHHGVGHNCAASFLFFGRRKRIGQEQGKGAALSFVAFEFDFAPEKPRQLTTDRQAKSRSTVAATGASVRLLERFEDCVLLVRWNSNSAVANRKREHRLGPLERRMRGTPTRGSGRHLQPDITALGK